MNKTIYCRRILTKNFTKIANEILDNAKLTYKAKGILICLLRHQIGYVVSIEDLANRTCEGKTSVRSGLKELQDQGYLQITQIREKNGKIIGYQWIVCDEPTFKNTANPESDNPISEKPPRENATLRSTTKPIKPSLNKTTTTVPLHNNLNSFDEEHASRISYLTEQLKIDGSAVEIQLKAISKETQIDILCEVLAVKQTGGLKKPPENLIAALVKIDIANGFVPSKGKTLKSSLNQLISNTHIDTKLDNRCIQQLSPRDEARKAIDIIRQTLSPKKGDEFGSRN